LFHNAVIRFEEQLFRALKLSASFQQPSEGVQISEV